jgi:hypothetical protein
MKVHTRITQTYTNGIQNVNIITRVEMSNSDLAKQTLKRGVYMRIQVLSPLTESARKHQ